MKINIGNDLYIKGRIGWKGLNKNEYLQHSLYKIINATALMDGYINWNNCGYISKERYDESEEIQLKENDILISKDGTLGKIGYVKNLQDFCTVASGIFVLRNTKPNLINFDYLYQLLKSSIFKDFIRRNKAEGSTINHLYQRDLENFEINLPLLQEQEKIANILSSLDKKIELNNKINEELEKTAKLIFDYWFIQFDFPNEEGKPYKSSGGKMVYNSQLNREIPENWEVTQIKNCIKHITTGLNPRDNFILNNGIIKYITVKNLTASGSLDLTNCDTINSKAQEIIHNRSKISIKDILFASIAPLGRCYLIQTPPSKWEINESIFSIRPNYNELSEYLYMHFRSEYFIKSAEHNSTGSVFAGIRINTLEQMDILLPPKNILNLFSNHLLSILTYKDKLENENQQLAELRDWLLPMLMNGQVKVEE